MGAKVFNRQRGKPNNPVATLVLDRGLEPAIVRVRGGPPNQLEESSINKALN